MIHILNNGSDYVVARGKAILARVATLDQAEALVRIASGLDGAAHGLTSLRESGMVVGQ